MIQTARSLWRPSIRPDFAVGPGWEMAFVIESAGEPVLRAHFHFNPAASVRGPKHVVKRGKTPVLTAKEARDLINSIAVYEINEETKQPDPDRPILIGMRDRALIGVMVLQLCPRRCHPRHEGGGLLHRRQAGMVPPA